jgi:DNA ligase-4
MEKFSTFCKVLSKIQKINKRETKKNLLEEYLNVIFTLFRNGGNLGVDLIFYDFYYLWFCITNKLDRERANYGLKEHRIAAIYLNALGIDKESHEGKVLIKFKDPTQNKIATGNFTECIMAILRQTVPVDKDSDLTVREINNKLDELAKCSTA